MKSRIVIPDPNTVITNLNTVIPAKAGIQKSV